MIHRELIDPGSGFSAGRPKDHFIIDLSGQNVKKCGNSLRQERWQVVTVGPARNQKLTGSVGYEQQRVISGVLKLLFICLQAVTAVPAEKISDFMMTLTPSGSEFLIKFGVRTLS